MHDKASSVQTPTISASSEIHELCTKIQELETKFDQSRRSESQDNPKDMRQRYSSRDSRGPRTVAHLDLADIITVTEDIPTDSLDFLNVMRDIEKPSLFRTNSKENRDEITRYNLHRYPHLTADDPLVSKSEQEIMRENINLEQSILNASETESIYEFLDSHRDAFSLYGELSHCPNYEADITLTNDEPFYIRPYRLSDEDKVIVASELDKLVRLGILAVGHQSYTSPVFLIPKKGTKDKRVVTDFRYLNSRIKRLNHPFPLLNETIRTIGYSGAKILGVLDLKSAFFCLPLSVHAQQYTGIASFHGGKHYYYKRLPQGLNLSPAIFQSQINDILATIPNSNKFCIAHHDDIIVYSADKRSHKQHLQAIFKVLMDNGLKISPKKCSIFQNSVRYMGHLLSITPEGEACIQPLHDRCAAIRNTPKPHNVKSVRRFVGAVNYVASFFPNIQALLRPLHHLSRKRKVFKWTEEHQCAFQSIKELLCNPPILHMPQKYGRFVLYSDTSRVATGSYLTQRVNGKENIIAYYSKILPPACQRYSVTELEMMGLFINVTAFKHLLQNVEFEAYVDHSAIVELFNQNKNQQLHAYVSFCSNCQNIHFRLVNKKGSELVLADYLSRAPQEFHSEIDQVAQEVSSYEDFSTPPKETFNPIMTRSRQGQWESKFQIYFRIKSQRSPSRIPQPKNQQIELKDIRS
ncbi:putative enzymatic polyprotein [Apostichopus japonicus]|uniref:Putative enzymatic polyprotein n=1 Tax=Stichopus japonicus TaxID=307972 RepID=A0A2G8JFQ9_STIJA|nr:putative enzymatic polyprotein [Apostichopus japonicus]